MTKQLTEVNQELYDFLISKEKEQAEANSLDKVPVEVQCPTETATSLGMSIKIAEYISKSKIDLETKAIGNNSPSGTLFVAIGQPKFRSASEDATFKLTNNKYPAGTKEKDFSEDDRKVLVIMSKITKQKDKILDIMLNAKTIDATEAYDLQIIDEIDVYDYDYKYGKNRRRYNKAEKTEK